MKKFLLSCISALVLCLTSLMPSTAAAKSSLLAGDINGDGWFSSADLVVFRRYLLGESDEITDHTAADFTGDSRLDAYDLCVMRRKLIEHRSMLSGKLISSPECRSAALYCADTRTLLYADSIDVRTAPASLTKLLTASVALNIMSGEDIVTVGSELSMVHSGSSLCYIAAGHKLKLRDLLLGMLLSSGNDAAYTVAVTTARAMRPDMELSDSDAVKLFAAMMNGFAADIGMNDSHFVNPDGWDDKNQFTTAHDLLVLTRHALSIPELREIVGTQQKYVVFASGENITWTNSNKLLDPQSSYYFANTVGVKTGTTANAGNCLIGAYDIGGRLYVSVVTGCATDTDRYELTHRLIEMIG